MHEDIPESSLITDKFESVFVKCINAVWVRQFNGPLELSWTGASGNGVDDDTLAIKTAFEVAKLLKCGLQGNGTYLCLRPLKVPAVSIYGDICIDMSRVFNPGSAYLTIGDSQHIHITSVAKVLDRKRVELVDAHRLSPGDAIILCTAKSGSWNPYRPSYKSGEVCLIASISGNVVNLQSPLYDLSYDGNTTVYAFADNDRVTISGITVVCSGKEAYPSLRIQNLRDSVVANIRVNGSTYANVQISSCFRLACLDIQAHSSSDSGREDGYSFRIVDSQAIRCSRLDLASFRHAFTVSATGGASTIVSRDITLSDSTVTCVGDASQALDVHGNIQNFRATNNTINGGVTIRGSGVKISDNVITVPSSSSSPAIYFDEIKCSGHSIVNNQITCYVSPLRHKRSIVFYFSGSSKQLSCGIEDSTNILIENNFVSVYLEGTVNCYFATFANRGSTTNIDLVIRGNQFHTHGGGCGPFRVTHVHGRPFRRIEESGNYFFNVGLQVWGDMKQGNINSVVLGAGTIHDGYDGPQVSIKFCDALYVSGQILRDSGGVGLYVDMGSIGADTSIVAISNVQITGYLKNGVGLHPGKDAGLLIDFAGSVHIMGCLIGSETTAKSFSYKIFSRRTPLIVGTEVFGNGDRIASANAKRDSESR